MGSLPNEKKKKKNVNLTNLPVLHHKDQRVDLSSFYQPRIISRGTHSLTSAVWRKRCEGNKGENLSSTIYCLIFYYLCVCTGIQDNIWTQWHTRAVQFALQVSILSFMMYSNWPIRCLGLCLRPASGYRWICASLPNRSYRCDHCWFHERV